MSDFRVALVAEGSTDAIIVEAALKALLPGPFVLTVLQPELTRPKVGTGWGGVLRWCHEFAMRGNVQIEQDPTLPGFDLFVLHTDADVAEYSYADVGPEVAAFGATQGWPILPNHVPCPPSDGSADVVRACLISWAGLNALGPKTVLCVPSKAIDAWLIAAIFDDGHSILNGLECNLNLEARLRVLPMAERLKKSVREYRAREGRITQAWAGICQRCSHAQRFSNEVIAVGV